MAKKKPNKRPKKIFHPRLLSLAAGAGWAAAHSPTHFGAPEEVGAWLISALAVALLVRAALALLAPIFGLLGEALRQPGNADHANDRNDA